MDYSFTSSTSLSLSDVTESVCEISQEFPKSGGRVLRSRRIRRQYDSHRPIKQLFTPKIKRYLKSWLIRRRDNPYPNREEKKDLAVKTGLTYIQICNWFANWRRKLKRTRRDFNKSTWGTLIKSYNGQADGNVEQFSISSEDSIWKEMEPTPSQSTPAPSPSKPPDHSYTTEPVPQCFQVSSTSDFQHRKKGKRQDLSRRKRPNRLPQTHNNHLYDAEVSPICSPTSTPLLLRRWLKSAACFQPRHGTYLPQTTFHFKTSRLYEDILSSMHGQEEVAAAEALTFLSRASKSS